MPIEISLTAIVGYTIVRLFAQFQSFGIKGWSNQSAAMPFKISMLIAWITTVIFIILYWLHAGWLAAILLIPIGFILTLLIGSPICVFMRSKSKDHVLALVGFGWPLGLIVMFYSLVES